MTPISVLVVAPTPRLAATLTEWLTDAGCEVTSVTSFSAGKAHLDDSPSILISEIRLGDYNGLHLALRAKSSDIPAIVVGSPDSVLQREAERLGVTYLTHQLDQSCFLETLQRLGHPEGATAKPIASPTTSNMSFVSWDELVPAVADRDESLSHGARRTLRS
jgi:DNA-binding NtrC family response regulator